MGVSCLRRSSDGNITPPNPDPKNFVIKELHQYGDNLIILAKYPGCTTFNGDKILVLRETHIGDYVKELDPHFSEDGRVIARFIPTKEGMEMAKRLLLLLNPDGPAVRRSSEE